MSKPKKKGSRVTPRGTQDPNGRLRIKVLGIPKTLDEYEAMYGIRPAAMPGSGYCMGCGKALVSPPAGPDKDHAVCHACFPEDLKEEWEGRQEDYVQVNLSEGTLEKIEPPLDPFVCNGMCMTAADVGVSVPENPVAYAHPDCPLHSPQ